MVDPIFKYQFRIILVGDSTVGKSSLLKYFTEEKFAEISDPTVGVDFFARLINVSDGTIIKLQLWDTAGQERFRSITKSYYRNSVGVILVYDICNIDSFKHVSIWMNEARRHIDPHRVIFYLVGCKHDLTSDIMNRRREVAPSDARDFAQHHNMGFSETSSKTGLNINHAFTVISQQIYDKVLNGSFNLSDDWDGVKPSRFESIPPHIHQDENNGKNSSSLKTCDRRFFLSNFRNQGPSSSPSSEVNSHGHNRNCC